MNFESSFCSEPIRLMMSTCSSEGVRGFGATSGASMHTDLTITEDSQLGARVGARVGAQAFGPIPALTATLVGNTVNPCKQPRPRVLCFSHDRILGDTRCAILQRSYDTVFVSSLDEVSCLLSASPFAVIVLCHTVSLEERQSCLALAWRMAKVVLVASESERPQPEIDQIVLGLAGPERLLDAVRQVLRPAVSLADLH